MHEFVILMIGYVLGSLSAWLLLVVNHALVMRKLERQHRERIDQFTQDLNAKYGKPGE